MTSAVRRVGLFAIVILGCMPTGSTLPPIAARTTSADGAPPRTRRRARIVVERANPADPPQLGGPGRQLSRRDDDPPSQ